MSGQQAGKRPAREPRGSTIFSFTCQNKRCRWYDTSWTVQVNADGTIPITLSREKQFERLDPVIARRVEENLQWELERQLQANDGETAEVRNPYA